MSPLIPFVDKLLSYLTVLGDILVPLLLLIIISYSGRKLFHPDNVIIKLLRRFGLLAAFIVAVIATGGSLFYSEVAGYLPCELCWFQRIFMYPQVIILGMALWKQQKNVILFSLPLTIIGGLIALYHYLLQTSSLPLPAPCSVTGYSVSCATDFVMELGYITIPMMSLTAFVLISLF